jgi:hypothetical protein
MKIGIIIQEGYPERLAEKQVRAMVGTNSVEIEEVRDLHEDTDDAIERLREAGCVRIGVLHRDDHDLQRFEGNLIAEYGHMFEAGVEVIPEGFYRLREADQTAAPANGAADQNAPDPGNLVQGAAIIFPVNFPAGEPDQEIVAFIKTYQDKIKEFSKILIVDWAPTNTGPHLGMAYNICLSGVVSLNSQKAVFEKALNCTASSIQNIIEQGGSAGLKIDPTAIFTYNGQPAPNPFQMNRGADKAFATFSQISKDLKDGKVKKNDEAVKKYLKKPGESGKIKFCADIITGVKALEKYNPAEGIPASKKGELVKEFMNTMGIMTDLQNLTQQMEKGGAGLAVRLGKFAADQAKKAKKDSKKKEAPNEVELLVSHPAFGNAYTSIAKNAKTYVKDEGLEKYMSSKEEKVEGDLGQKAQEAPAEGAPAGGSNE